MARASTPPRLMLMTLRMVLHPWCSNCKADMCCCEMAHLVSLVSVTQTLGRPSLGRPETREVSPRNGSRASDWK